LSSEEDLDKVTLLQDSLKEKFPNHVFIDMWRTVRGSINASFKPKKEKKTTKPKHQNDPSI